MPAPVGKGRPKCAFSELDVEIPKRPMLAETLAHVGPDPFRVNNEAPHWETFNVAMWKGHHCYLEIVDLSIANHNGKGLKPDGYAAVQQLWISSNGKSPDGVLPRTGEVIKPDGANSPEAVALLKKYLQLANTVPRPATVPVMLEGTARNEKVFIRGGHGNLGPEVPRRFLTALVGEHPPMPAGSGRITLANQIADTANPLTARVYANRIWHHLLGRGIVPSTDNFGVLGEAPTHPVLLNDLAARFVKNNWSLKWLHREILQSATWQQSIHNPAAQKADPANEHLARMNRRRLDVEAWRDAMLHASGQLDQTIGGEPKDLNAKDNRRRTLYGAIHRREPNQFLRIHDFPDPTAHAPTRPQTITPLQQLFTLNGPFIHRQAEALAAHLMEQKGTEVRIISAHQKLFQRAPRETELKIAKSFLKGKETDAAYWTQYAHALLAGNEFQFID